MNTKASISQCFFVSLLLLIVALQPVKTLIDYNNTNKASHEEARRYPHITAVPETYCNINQYFDKEEGRCLGLPGGGRLITINETISCGTDVLKPHCSDTRFYYVCKEKKSILAVCAERQRFDNRLQRCATSHLNFTHLNIPRDQDTFVNIKTPPCFKPGWFPVSEHCGVFYVCVTNGQRLFQSVYKCPNNTQYDAVKRICSSSTICNSVKSQMDSICVPEVSEEHFPSDNGFGTPDEYLEENFSEDIRTTSAANPVGEITTIKDISSQFSQVLDAIESDDDDYESTMRPSTLIEESESSTLEMVTESAIAVLVEKKEETLATEESTDSTNMYQYGETTMLLSETEEVTPTIPFYNRFFADSSSSVSYPTEETTINPLCNNKFSSSNEICTDVVNLADPNEIHSSPSYVSTTPDNALNETVTYSLNDELLSLNMEITTKQNETSSDLSNGESLNPFEVEDITTSRYNMIVTTEMIDTTDDSIVTESSREIYNSAIANVALTESTSSESSITTILEDTEEVTTKMNSADSTDSSVLISEPTVSSLDPAILNINEFFSINEAGNAELPSSMKSPKYPELAVSESHTEEKEDAILKSTSPTVFENDQHLTSPEYTENMENSNTEATESETYLVSTTGSTGTKNSKEISDEVVDFVDMRQNPDANTKAEITTELGSHAISVTSESTIHKVDNSGVTPAGLAPTTVGRPEDFSVTSMLYFQSTNRKLETSSQRIDTAENNDATTKLDPSLSNAQNVPLTDKSVNINDTDQPHSKSENKDIEKQLISKGIPRLPFTSLMINITDKIERRIRNFLERIANRQTLLNRFL